MARKIFVSYKHKDPGVRLIANIFEQTTARHYVDKLREYLDAEDHIYKGEGNEDLSEFKDDTIQTRLKEKIFDSSITIILISKNMRNPFVSENDQWIPWEVSYSLREKTKDGRTSAPNAFLAVALPDENNSYEYFIRETGCPTCRSINWNTESLFQILRKNMFNKKQPQTITCRSGVCGPYLYTGEEHSYMYPLKWDNFLVNVNAYIDHATRINQNINDYNLTKVIC